MLLRLDKVQRHFGGVHAVDQVSLDVEEGSIQGLIGPNGAGKTTLVNVITGYVPYQTGKAWLQKDEITGLRPYRIASIGISRTFQNIRLFKDLTAIENILVGMHARRRDDTLAQLATLPVFRRDQKGRDDEARQLMEMVGLSPVDLGQRAAGTLPYGDQRRLQIPPRAPLRRPAPPRDRPRPGPAADTFDPGRAGGRHEPVGEARHARADRTAQQR